MMAVGIVLFYVMTSLDFEPIRQAAMLEVITLWLG
ncbi:hypothetical protein MCEMSE6_02314 [Oxalobacteraceae bacterium]